MPARRRRRGSARLLDERHAAGTRLTWHCCWSGHAWPPPRQNAASAGRLGIAAANRRRPRGRRSLGRSSRHLRRSAGSGDVAQTARAYRCCATRWHAKLVRGGSGCRADTAPTSSPSLRDLSQAAAIRRPPAAPDLSWRLPRYDPTRGHGNGLRFCPVARRHRAPRRVCGRCRPHLAHRATRTQHWLFPGGSACRCRSSARISLLGLDWNNDFGSTCSPPARPASDAAHQTDGRIRGSAPHRRSRRHRQCHAAVSAPGRPTSKWTATSTSCSASPAVRTMSFGTTATARGLARADVCGTSHRVSAFAWADLDRDGDPDAVFQSDARTFRVFMNSRAGAFRDLPRQCRNLTSVAALTVADMDADGLFDIVTVDADGEHPAAHPRSRRRWRGDGHVWRRRRHRPETREPHRR